MTVPPFSSLAIADGTEQITVYKDDSSRPVTMVLNIETPISASAAESTAPFEYRSIPGFIGTP